MTRNRASSAGMATRHVGLVRYPYPTIQLFRVVTKTSSASVRLIEWFGHIDEQEKAYPAVFETTGYAFCSCNSLWRPLIEKRVEAVSQSLNSVRHWISYGILIIGRLPVLRSNAISNITTNRLIVCASRIGGQPAAGSVQSSRGSGIQGASYRF